MKQTKSCLVQATALLLISLILPALACTGRPEVSATRLAPSDLSGQDFSHRRFAGEDFSGKKMQQVNLSGAEILNSNFSGVDMQNANFREALIQKNNFSEANLRGANLDLACMDDENVWLGAQLDDKWAKYIALLERGIEPGQDLRGYDLSNVCVWLEHLDKVNLAGVNLQGAKIFDSFLVGANLAYSDLRNANIIGSDLHDADLTGADLTGATLSSVNLEGAIVTQEQLNAAAKLDCVRLPDGTLVPKCYGEGP